MWPLATIYRPEPELQLRPRSKIGGLTDLAQPYPLRSIVGKRDILVDILVDVPLCSEVSCTFLCQVNLADIDHHRLGRFQTLTYLAHYHSSVEEFLAEGNPYTSEEYYSPLELIDLLLDREETNLLPKLGLLSFFYDAVTKQWVFDAYDSSSCKLIYTPSDTVVEPVTISNVSITEYLPSSWHRNT